MFRNSFIEHQTVISIDTMSKIVAVIASPRKAGNCVAIVEKMAEAAKAKGNDVEIFNVNTLEFKGCQACMGCKKAGQGCIRKDGLTPVLDAIKECDGLILATPDYFGQPTGQYRCFEDRMYGYLGGDFSCCIKPGLKFVPVVTSGSGAGADDIVNGIKRVMAGYFKMECIGEINYSEAAGKGPAKDNADVMAQAAKLAGKF